MSCAASRAASGFRAGKRCRSTRYAGTKGLTTVDIDRAELAALLRDARSAQNFSWNAAVAPSLRNRSAAVLAAMSILSIQYPRYGYRRI